MSNRTTETIRFKKLPGADSSRGHRPLPAIFYEAIFYGLSAMNPNGQMKTDKYNTLAHKEMGIALSYMPFRPVFIHNCTFHTNGGIQQGYVLEYTDINRDIEQRVQFEARRFGQIAMLKWFAHSWGADHSSVIQHVIATTAGYHTVESKGPVYLV